MADRHLIRFVWYGFDNSTIPNERCFFIVKVHIDSAKTLDHSSLQVGFSSAKVELLI